MNNSIISSRHLYDTYSPILYGIALEISQTGIEAEEIMLGTFKKIINRQFIEQEQVSICATLIKLVIQTANEQGHQGHLKNNFMLKQFGGTAAIHKLLFKKVTVETYAEENKLTRREVAQKLREEFICIRNR